MEGTRGAVLGQKSMAELGSDLAREMTSLVHHEIELAKAEMAEKGKRAGLGAGMFGAAGLLAAFGFGCVTAFFFVAALQLGMAVWLAALIVGLVYVAGAGVLALLGRRQINQATPPVPRKRWRAPRRMWNRSRPRRSPHGNRTGPAGAGRHRPGPGPQDRCKGPLRETV